MDNLFIDLGTGRTTTERLGESDLVRGGRYATAAIVQRLVPPSADPLGPRNVVVLAGGPLAGVGLTSTGRLSVGGKSPLTGGIKEANAGGTAGDSLARLGWRTVVLTGRRPPGERVLVVVDESGAHLRPCPELAGLGNFALAERLRAEYGSEYTLVAVGPAGEAGLAAAGAAVTDIDFRPSRFAARGGLGAVLGTKGVKGVLIKRNGRRRPPGADSPAFREARRAFNETVRVSGRSRALAEYGTASTLAVVDHLGGLPTRNFSRGRFEGADRINGDALHELIQARGGDGECSHACMAGCVIRCSNVVPGPDGRETVSPLEYETLALMGSNLGLDDLDVIARLNRLANDLGLDTIEVGATLGVLAEAGLARFGDGARFEELLGEAARGTVLGRLVGSGCATAGRLLGVRRVPAAKGQAFGAYDPRAVKGTGVTFATSPMGADHTAGLTVFADVDHSSKEGQAELSLRMQVARAAYDGLGLCAFLQSAVGSRPQLVTELLSLLWGVELSPEYLEALGREILRVETNYNRAAGLGPEQDRLPEFIQDEPLPPFDWRWDISVAELRAVAEELAGTGEAARNPRSRP